MVKQAYSEWQQWEQDIVGTGLQLSLTRLEAEIQGHPWPYTVFKDSLGYIKLYLQIKLKKKKGSLQTNEVLSCLLIKSQWKSQEFLLPGTHPSVILLKA